MGVYTFLGFCFQGSYFYIQLLKAVLRHSTASLKAADARELASSITAIANEKLKAEKQANGSKKKQGNESPDPSNYVVCKATRDWIIQQSLCIQYWLISRILGYDCELYEALLIVEHVKLTPRRLMDMIVVNLTGAKKKQIHVEKEGDEFVGGVRVDLDDYDFMWIADIISLLISL